MTMAAKYEIVLLCGHHKYSFFIAKRVTNHYCYICHKELPRDMNVEAKLISVGVTGN